jgi:hypothetical protein
VVLIESASLARVLPAPGTGCPFRHRRTLSAVNATRAGALTTLGDALCSTIASRKTFLVVSNTAIVSRSGINVPHVSPSCTLTALVAGFSCTEMRAHPPIDCAELTSR